MRVRSRHFANDHYTGPRGRRFLQILGSVFRQQLEPLPFGQMAWRDHLKVPASRAATSCRSSRSASAITHASTA